MRGLGYQRRVKKSYIFLYWKFSKLEAFTLNHFDFYRFETPEEFEDAGFRENYGPGQVTISEWTSKAEPFVPEADVGNRYHPGSRRADQRGQNFCM